ncbi:hypothetical protein Cni_G26321 [Canna indica]|uniref:Uncharacterized protein n=1 Tax=Canna indica TaxID=4628 RepID=A0AAQ3L2P4_9LILI|nr:hypothetical protein Cni_G26321 [Canna indica]
MAIDNTIHSYGPIPKTLIISYYEFDFQRIDKNLHDSVVIFVIAGNFIIKKVIVDQGSSVVIFPHSIFEKMQLAKASLSPCNGDLVGFLGEKVNVRGAIWLKTTFNSQLKAKTINVHYLVIDIPRPYHMIWVDLP